MSEQSRDDRLKALCDRLARAQGEHPNRHLVEMTLKHSRLLPPRSRRPSPLDTAGERVARKEVALEGPRAISIWEPRTVDGELVWVRPDSQCLGDGYSARKTIARRKPPGMQRVCFLGESVALGFLYAPHVTPAGVLQDQLRALAGASSYEVVDLSKSSESLLPLVQTTQAAMQLDPDVFVIFTGNNWSFQEPEVTPYIPIAQARKRYAKALREGGIDAVVELAKRALEHKAALAMATIAEAAGAARVPVIVIVPEVNLADWQSRQPVVWRSDDATERWHAGYVRAVQLLEQQKWQEAIEAAQALQAIDNGTSPSAHRIVAIAYRALGRDADAARACRAEVDSDPLPTMAFLHGPQATSAVKQMLRRACDEHGFACVDLPHVFAQYLGSALPGRRLFLDYCHLTVEGMKVAMAAVSGKLLELRGGGEDAGDWQRLLERLPDPVVPAEIDAMGKLGAAIHTSHRMLAVGSKAPILEHWCQAAFDASPAVATAMLELIDLRCAPCPSILSDAQRRNFASSHRFMHQHGLQWENIDAEIIEAICLTLEANGVAAREKITQLLIDRVGIGCEPTELTRSGFYHWELNARIFADVLNIDDFGHRAGYHAAAPVSAFCIVCDAAHDVRLEVTARLPAIDGWPNERRGPVHVAINGNAIGVFECCQRWSRDTLRARQTELRRGINKLTVHWPAPPPAADAALRLAASRLDRGVGADVHPIFGEIYSLVARTCS